VETSIFGAGGLGKEDFLRLLVTQLRHQDPLEPLQAQDFASQLAQFTALEQQIQTNELLEEQIRLRGASALDAQNSVAIGLIGNQVVIEGDQLSLSGTDSDAAFVATTGPARLTVRVTDGSGTVVAEVGATVSTAGVNRVDLGDSTEGLPAGAYRVSVEVVSAADGVQAKALGSGVVTGVRWGDSGPMLVVGDREVMLSEVLQISN
jgi:flagellar basal-body rod modification protein FlgD